MKKIYKEAIMRMASEGEKDKPHWELERYLVRCYRCKFSKRREGNCDSYECEYNDKYLVFSHDFCSRGERKEEDELTN